MDVVPGHRALLERYPAPAVAIGMFDGVHRGHRELIRRAIAAAGPDGTPIGLTFDPHPQTVLQPAAPRDLLTSTARRLELLAEAGLAACVVEPFTPELAAVPADEFVDRILVAALGVRHVVVGWDWRYGHARAGTIETLTAHGARAGFTVDAVPPVLDGGEPISSTRIRDVVRSGDVATAARLLGRPYDVDGAVVHGAERGRAIGIPTANVAPDIPVLAPLGIYAVWLRVDGGARLPAVASLGTNPTFVTEGAITLEVHVLDYSGDLYDRRVRVELVGRLRGEARFDSVDALVAQIRRDIADARRVLDGNGR